MGSLLNVYGTKNPDPYHGWFIAWIEKGDRRIIFSNHLEDEKKEEIAALACPKLDTKENLTKIIESIEDN